MSIVRAALWLLLFTAVQCFKEIFFCETSFSAFPPLKKIANMGILRVMNIAWIGTGVMGVSMARNLARSGHKVRVYSRTVAKCEPLKEFGIEVATTIADCVQGAEAVFTIVGYPKDVEQVYLGAGGIFENATDATLLIDMTTSSPLLAKKMYDAAVGGKGDKTFRILDAPVSGGDTGAKNASLSIMVGGDKTDFDIALPLLEVLGKNITYLGDAGSGQHCKACNQVAIAGTIAGCAEAVYYAQKNGLDAQAVLSAISKGAAGSWQMDNNAPKMIVGDYAPGFFNKHFIKDMGIARDVMAEQGKKLPVLDTVFALYESLVAKGMGDEGTQSIIESYK